MMATGETTDMRQLRFALAFACLAVAAPAGAEVKLVDSGKTQTIDCAADGEIAIPGAMNTVTLTGSCTKVAISGADNTVTIASALKVAVSGTGNRVEVAAADKIAVSGVGNSVRYDRGVNAKAPKIANSGLKNSIVKKASE